MRAIFGPAGTPEDFKLMGYKSSLDIPDYIEKTGLDCFEYQCGQGVRIGEDLARNIALKAKEKNVVMSVHAPYFISLSSVEKEKRDKSIDYILQSARAADWLGGTRIVIHSGSCSKMTREEALSLAKDTLKRAREALVSEGLSHIRCCPETMGKINQLGDLNEVMELCLVDESFIPCIDFGHLNARTFGNSKTREDYEFIFKTIENRLGKARLNEFHSHFSKIEYTENGGEKRHLTFSDTTYGPEYEPLMELVYEYGIAPTFICESSGTQGIDAKSMKEYYINIK